MSPEYVRPYVKAQKNDDRDAEAIAEAATRPTMALPERLPWQAVEGRFVALKTKQQLDMQTLRRIRDQLVGERTPLMNQIRSLLIERGHIVAQGRARLAVRLGEMLKPKSLFSGPAFTGLSRICVLAGSRSTSGSGSSTRSSLTKRAPMSGRDAC